MPRGAEATDTFDALLSARARQLEIYSVIHLYNRIFYNNSKNNYNRLITVELLITIVLAVFLSWCVCNDVPSLSVCALRDLHFFNNCSIHPSLIRSIISFIPFRVSESISHRSFNTHDTTHIRLLNLTSLNLHKPLFAYTYARGRCTVSRS